MSRTAAANFFFCGRYAELLATTVDLPDFAVSTEVAAFAVGALAFRGRGVEAESLFARQAGRWRPDDEVMARLFLGLSAARRADYGAARRLFAANLRAARAPLGPRGHFFAAQGIGFYDFFTGRLAKARRSAERALAFAAEADFLYGKVLAQDLLGHILVHSGDVSVGLAALELALTLTSALGDGGIAEALRTSLLIYRAQFGLGPATAVEELRAKIATLMPEDSYSQSNLLLELGRQLTLRGQFAAAQATLDRAAQLVYAGGNRRHEVVLRLRYGHLLHYRGELQQALTHVRAAAKMLDSGVDQLLGLQVEGLTHKLECALAAGKRDRAPRSGFPECGVSRRMLRRAQARTGSRLGGGAFDDHIDSRPGSDGLGDLIDAIACSSDPLPLILGCGFYALAYDFAGFARGRRQLLAQAHNGSLTAFDPAGVHHEPSGLTPLLRDLLRRLAQGPASKQELVETVWTYRRYAPLRHDAMVYSAVSSLRRLLGDFHDWIRVTERGYALAADVTVYGIDGATTQPSTPAEPPALNFRQLEILAYLRAHPYIDVRTCCDRFVVSEMTAWRDLASLTARDLVVRVGRARLSKYTATSPSGVPL